MLGEVETTVGLAGDAAPRFTSPSYVKECYVSDMFVPTFAAGGSPDERMCLSPDRGSFYYPVGSSCLKYEKRVHKGDPKIPGSRTLTMKGWPDVEMIVRNALMMAKLHCKGRHVVGVLPSRSTIKFRAAFLEFLFKEHGAASVCVAPLSVCAMQHREPTLGWRGTATVVECGPGWETGDFVLTFLERLL